MNSPHQPDPDQDLDPTTETRAIAYQEVPNNHLSPMGQVDDVGRFARGAGHERLTRWFRIGIIVVGGVWGLAFLLSRIG